LICRYPSQALWGDYARAGVGLVVGGAPLLLDLSTPLLLGCVGLMSLFAVYGVQALGRGRLRLTVSDAGVRIQPGDRDLGWDGLNGMRLAYYTTRRDGRGGWMELKLSWERYSLRVDSRIESFDALVRLAAARARSAGIGLDSGSVDNLSALGVDPAGQNADSG